jgi:hypothetical protein
MRPVNITDKLGHQKVQSLEDPLFLLIDAQQKMDSPALAISSIAMLLRLECEALGLDLSDVMSYTANAHEHLRQTDTQKLRAIAEYIRQELK